jgi:hypothetical protein
VEQSPVQGNKITQTGLKAVSVLYTQELVDVKMLEVVSVFGNLKTV